MGKLCLIQNGHLHHDYRSFLMLDEVYKQILVVLSSTIKLNGVFQQRGELIKYKIIIRKRFDNVALLSMNRENRVSNESG